MSSGSSGQEETPATDGGPPGAVDTSMTGAPGAQGSTQENDAPAAGTPQSAEPSADASPEMPQTSPGMDLGGAAGGSPAPETGSPEPAPMPAPEVTGSNVPPPLGRVVFELPKDSAELDFIRAYVGLAPGKYEVSVDLREIEIGAGGRASATEPELARILTEPGLYYVALTSVDVSGRESSFSNELRFDRRGN